MRSGPDHVMSMLGCGQFEDVMLSNLGAAVSDMMSSSKGRIISGTVWFIFPLYIFKVMVGLVRMELVIIPRCLVMHVLRILKILMTMYMTAAVMIIAAMFSVVIRFMM